MDGAVVISERRGVPRWLWCQRGRSVEGGHVLTLLNAPGCMGCCSPRALPLSQVLVTWGEGDQGTWRDRPSLPSACFQFPEGPGGFQEWEPPPWVDTAVVPGRKLPHGPLGSQTSAGRSPEVSTPAPLAGTVAAS